jgi:hypothetical protein
MRGAQPDHVQPAHDGGRVGIAVGAVEGDDHRDAFAAQLGDHVIRDDDSDVVAALPQLGRERCAHAKNRTSSGRSASGLTLCV